MSKVERNTKWHATFASIFLVAALGFIFANAWNMVAATMLKKYEKKDSQGNPINPVNQTVLYALGISVLCALVVWFYHDYTNVRL